MDPTQIWPSHHPPPPSHHPPPPSHHLHHLHHHPYPAPPHQYYQEAQPPAYHPYHPAYYLNPNPNPTKPPASAGPHDPYAPHGGYLVGPSAAVDPSTGLAAYYYERGTADPNVYGGCSVQPHAAKPHGSKKGPKPTKVVQSVYCMVCKIDCNSQEVLNSHKQGKKHKKNLQKLQEAITPKPQKTQTITNPVMKKEDPNSSVQKKRKEVPEEDVETKKRKLLEGGVEPDQVKVCTICNVVVNSQKVYSSHISGSKHAAMVKKQSILRPS